jgi:FkbM family methyltransferase
MLDAAALQAMFNQGLALHQQGKLADAERLYGEILQRQPNHFGALHLLGVVAVQTGRTERGVELIREATGLNPKAAVAHSNLGKALLDLKRPDEALASCDKAIALQPDYAEAYHIRGIALNELKRLDEALASYDWAIALKPDYAEAQNNRRNALKDLDRPEEDNGWVVLPASLKLPTNAPRFHLSFPIQLNADLGARHLIASESRGGYELSTRNLFERILRAGDVFLDVGAHWGFFTLQAATHPAGNVRVIAFEPDPMNASILFRNIQKNAVTKKVSVVCAACGDNFDIAPLVSNSSMMHSIGGVGLKPPFARGDTKWIPVIPLDSALARFPSTAGARLILKVDVEGFEPQVIAGAQSLLQSGLIALIVWECGHAFTDGSERSAMIEMVNVLSDHGFRHLRPLGQAVDGPFEEFNSQTPYGGNVFSFGKNLIF